MKTKQLDICVVDLMHQAQIALAMIAEPKDKVQAISRYLQALAMLNASITEETFQYGAYFECIKDNISRDTSDYYSEAVIRVEEAMAQEEKTPAIDSQKTTSEEAATVQTPSAEEKTEETPQSVVYLDDTQHLKVVHEIANSTEIAGLTPQEIETWINWFEEYCGLNPTESIEEDFKTFCNGVYASLTETDKDTLLAYIFSLYAKLYPEKD